MLSHTSVLHKTRPGTCRKGFRRRRIRAQRAGGRSSLARRQAPRACAPGAARPEELVTPANASAPARTASGSAGATSGGCGPSAAPTTRPERCGRVVEPSRPGESQPTLRALAESGAARRVLPRWRVARAGRKLGPLRVAPELCPAGAPILEGASLVATRHDTMSQAIAPDPSRGRTLNRWGVAHGGEHRGRPEAAPRFWRSKGAKDGPSFLRRLSAVPARPTQVGCEGTHGRPRRRMARRHARRVPASSA
jgi:hypothetical protein